MAHWADYYANRQQSRNHDLAMQIKASLTDPENMANMAHPKGVAVFIYGLGQRSTNEGPNGRMCTEDKTELDNKEANRKEEGWVTINVDADTLAQVGKFNEPSDTGVKMLADAVLSISTAGSMGGAGGSLPIEINAFSRGGGGAVALTNELTRAGVQGSSVTVNLTDPYMGPNSHTIKDPSVHVSLSRAIGGLNPLVGFVAGLADYTRDLSQQGSAGRQPLLVPFAGYNLPHTQMDNLWPFGAVMP
jgi:hypothetical protein